jgi:hypothetical protein
LHYAKPWHNETEDKSKQDRLDSNAQEEEFQLATRDPHIAVQQS